MAHTGPAIESLKRVQKVRSEFEARVERVVRAIPRGRVLAYSRVAILAGFPGAARRVGKVLGGLKGVPWWRVIRADLTLAEPVAEEQTRRLLKEGVQVSGRRVPKSARATLAEVSAALERVMNGR